MILHWVRLDVHLACEYPSAKPMCFVPPSLTAVVGVLAWAAKDLVGAKSFWLFIKPVTLAEEDDY